MNLNANFSTKCKNLMNAMSEFGLSNYMIQLEYNLTPNNARIGNNEPQPIT